MAGQSRTAQRQRAAVAIGFCRGLCGRPGAPYCDGCYAKHLSRNRLRNRRLRLVLLRQRIVATAHMHEQLAALQAE